MNINLDDKNLTTLEQENVESLLSKQKENLDDLEQMWFLMDLVWDECKCDNKILELDKVGNFYSHPVWLLNGLFIEQHDDSMLHRDIMSDWIVKKKFKNIVDYGGGFGTLSRLIAQKDTNIDVSIYEPHPSKFGLKRAAEFENIDIIDSLESNYDCLVCVSVLEHVPDPLKDFYEMIKIVKTGGYLVIENCFSPVIKCHLPQTFHLKYTFNYFAKMMGLEVVGKLEGSYSTVFKKIDNKEVDLLKIRFYQNLSKFIYFIIETSKTTLRPLKKII